MLKGGEHFLAPSTPFTDPVLTPVLTCLSVWSVSLPVWSGSLPGVLCQVSCAGSEVDVLV